VSTASVVPETFDLDDGRALVAMREAKVWLLAKDSGSRLRWADGFSHSRAMAFQLVLTLIPGAIALVALASELHWGRMSTAIINLTRSLAPGPAGAVFEDAFGQGSQAGTTTSGWAALGLGGLAFMVAGTTAYGQIERTANRIYGIEADRPFRRKYGQALAMMLTSGVLAVAGFAVISLGERWAAGWKSYSLDDVWVVARWPIGLGLLTVAITLIFKVSPRRHQPSIGWLAMGAAISVLGVSIVSLGFHVYLRTNQGFGDTYGPLAGVIGVLLWAYLSCIALFYGLAFAAQLEAFRGGSAEPRSVLKVRSTDPRTDATDLHEEPDPDDVDGADGLAPAVRAIGPRFTA
jgi:YihY family inner membrane protein